MSNLVPDGWNIHKISDVSKVGSSKRILQSEYVTEGVPFFRSKEVILRSKRETVKDTLYISRERFEELKNRFAAPASGEILVTAVGTIGVIYLVEDFEFYFKDGNLLWIKDVDEKVNSEYLAKYMASDFFQTSIKRISGGSSQAALTIEKLSELEFNLPPLPEQQKIAKILTSVDEVIEKTQAQIDKLKDLKTGMMQELLTNGIGHTEFKDSPVGRIPAEWHCVKMNEIAKVTDGAHHTPTYTSSGVPFLRVTDLKNKSIFRGNIKYVSEDEHQQLIKRCKPERNDILYSKNGTIGIPRLVDWDEEFSIFVSLALIKITSKGIQPVYLSLFMDSPIVREQIRKRSKQGTVTNLHLEEIREFDIPLPSLEEQAKITSTLQSIINKTNIVSEKLASYKNTKKALMQDLFTGKIRVKV